MPAPGYGGPTGIFHCRPPASNLLFMVTGKTETERKYVADSAVRALPPLTDLPHVTAASADDQQVLDAEYYDTPDLRLIKSGVTLRRRYGGSDEGWHLKLPS